MWKVATLWASTDLLHKGICTFIGQNVFVFVHFMSIRDEGSL